MFFTNIFFFFHKLFLVFSMCILKYFVRAISLFFTKIISVFRRIFYFLHVQCFIFLTNYNISVFSRTIFFFIILQCNVLFLHKRFLFFSINFKFFAPTAYAARLSVLFRTTFYFLQVQFEIF